MKTTGNTILITGGGSGIGRGLAQRWHDLGNHVIVTGRTLSSLQETIVDRPGMVAMTLDVTDPAHIVRFTEQVIADHPTLNVLINNAGIMRIEDLTGARDLADPEAIVATNLLGPIRMIDALVGHLSAQEDAAIVNVSSGLAFVPMAITPTYSATKAGLHSYTDSLRHQLAGKIEVIEIVPPGVQTELTPGQSNRSEFMPLAAFVDEVVDLFAQTPTPPEITVRSVMFLRKAEAEGHYAAAFALINRG